MTAFTKRSVAPAREVGCAAAACGRDRRRAVVDAVNAVTARLGQTALQRGEIIVDGTTVLFPQSWFWSADDKAVLPPPDGSLFWEASLSTSMTVVRFYYLDFSLLGTSNPIVTVEGTGTPAGGDAAGLVLLGYSIGGVFTAARGYPVAGNAPGGASRNLCPAGKNPARCGWIFETSPASVVQAGAFRAAGTRLFAGAGQ